MAMLGGKLYVANYDTKNIAVIQNDKVVKFIPVGDSPVALAADTAQNRLYVVNVNDKTISLITNDQVTLTQNIGDSARSLVFLENKLWVGLDFKSTMLVLDAATLSVQSRIIFPENTSIISMASDAARHRIYVGNYEKTSVIDTTTNRILTTFPSAGSFGTIAVNSALDFVLIGTYDSATSKHSLTTFDVTTNQARSAAPIGSNPREALVNAAGSRAYVANSLPNTISVIDTQSMTTVANVFAGAEPSSLALDESAKRLYIANANSHNISILNTDTNQTIGVIPLSIVPTAMLGNETLGRLYIANASTDSVFVIQDTSIVKEIPVGHHPADLTRDEKTNRLFVANGVDHTISIIDESNFSVRATQPITSYLSTVGVDAGRSRLFANDVILDLNTLSPIGRLTMSGGTLYSVIAPQFTRVNPNTGRIYANASNGTPGSNGRYVTYSIDGNTLKQGGIGLPYYGNTSAFEIDPENNRVYLAGTHPLAYTNDFSVFDSNDAKIFSMALSARTIGMAYNPKTHHLFLSHAESYGRPYNTPLVQLADNTIQILDTTTFGQVASLSLPNTPGKMARVGNSIYVVTRDDNSVTLIQDVATAAPPAPTATITPTPYPTSTRTPAPPTRTATPVAQRTPTRLICSIPVTGLAVNEWTPDVAARIGCPTLSERAAQFAVQSYERGTMFYRDDEKKIYVLFNDQTWQAFDDTWNSAGPADSCPSITVSGGLVKPQRGFGKVWCDQSAVRSKIGAATGSERGMYSAQTYKFERGHMFAGEQASQVFVLFSDSKWE